MGTRHLITVKSEGKIKVSQYGQWDGYLTGVGNDIVEFLTDISNISRLRLALNNCSFVPDTYIDSLMAKHNLSDSEFVLRYPEFNRDTSAKLLDILCRSRDVQFKLINSYEFRKDTLFCEYHYLIDLDMKTLKIYRGSTRAWKTIKFSDLKPFVKGGTND
jgi:hypothetical protein